MLPAVSGLAPNDTPAAVNTTSPGSYLVCYLYYTLLGTDIIAGAVLWAYFFRHGLGVGHQPEGLAGRNSLVLTLW